MLKRLFKSAQPRAAAPSATVPNGQRIYAVGDIHGRLDLFEALLARIDADDRSRGPAQSQIILLGDLIDRGPESAGVVERAMQLVNASENVRILRGNHEEIMLTAIEGSEQAMRLFTQVGGRETLLSYGVELKAYNDADFAELIEIARNVVPQSHLDFIDSFENAIEIGDYLFVHAGVRPGIPLEEQKERDLRWIRREFLEHRGDFGKVVVHGHSISPEVELRSNRIGIDTGAFDSDRLTAIGLEAGERWFIQTSVADSSLGNHIAANAP